MKSFIYKRVDEWVYRVCILWLFTTHQQRKIVWTPLFWPRSYIHWCIIIIYIIIYYFITQFLYQAIVLREPQRDPSNHRLHENGIWYIWHCTRTRNHNLFRHKQAPVPLGHCDGLIIINIIIILPLSIWVYNIPLFRSFLVNLSSFSLFILILYSAYFVFSCYFHQCFIIFMCSSKEGSDHEEEFYYSEMEVTLDATLVDVCTSSSPPSQSTCQPNLSSPLVQPPPVDHDYQRKVGIGKIHFCLYFSYFSNTNAKSS